MRILSVLDGGQLAPEYPANDRKENFTSKQRFRLKLEKSLKVLNELGKWMSNTSKEVLPKSQIGQAIAYCFPRWDNLMNYLQDGSLVKIDNNMAKNAISPIALGSKNYLFAGSERGAERAAMFYSFFATCKKNNVNPLYPRYQIGHR